VWSGMWVATFSLTLQSRILMTQAECSGMPVTVVPEQPVSRPTIRTVLTRSALATATALCVPPGSSAHQNCNCPLCAARQQRTSELQLPFVCRQAAAHIRTATALCVPPGSSAHHKTYRSLLLPEFFADILGSLQKPVE
jgi:hypothetical protein